MSIPGLQYGQGGSFAVVFWTRMDPDYGASLDYAYSHVNLRNKQFAFDPNEVHRPAAAAAWSACQNSTPACV